MEHEVYVPFPVETVRQALAEPERVARCIPGCQLDADADPGTPGGRLRLRIGSSTITYRGTLTVTARGADTVTVEAGGIESRGDGSAELSLTVRLAAHPDDTGATALHCAGTVTSTGRLAEAAPQTAESAARRLLDRFAANLAADLADEPPQDRPAEPQPAPPAHATPGVFDSEVPPPSLDPLADADDQDGAAPAEAAHARRTMIGRSAEEVDHAPPRGRYAPVPAPQSTTTSATLRWAAPAAALALASAVVVGRVLRRRR
ncbi:SRPBCC domain-containing protein [Streptomyces sp. NPDC017529]|uniref:SRPBCC domain-containing protein n=1 Tax=Streptomyces sp. NPDC017529 TaxID=3365000 RepID=UPI0037B9A12D